MDPPRFASRGPDGFKVMTAHLHSAFVEANVPASGPDGSRALAPHLLVVLARGARRVYYQVQRKPVRPMEPSLDTRSSKLGRTDTSPVQVDGAASHTAIRYGSPWTINAQRIRAFLFARATQARLKPRLSMTSRIQIPRLSVLLSQRRSIDLAP